MTWPRILARHFGPAFRLTAWFTVLTGLVYPLAMTGLCQWLFPRQANGSLLRAEGRVVGSALLGQNFTAPQYFHPRPSAAGNGYDGLASGGSNLGPLNPQLTDRVAAAVKEFRRENPQFRGPIPADLPTTSASGLDPDISPAAAGAQAARVARARGLSPAVVRELIRLHTEGRAWGLWGEPRVNVLELNLALDRVRPGAASRAAVAGRAPAAEP